MFNIEFLDLVMSACFTLRKVKLILIHEHDKIYKLRPQIHPMIISPFGTAKSSITKELEDKYPDCIYEMDDVTKPAITGSVRKDGEYIPSVLENVGGKIMIIDEFNSIEQHGQGALLSVLENQKMRRALGFKVTKPYIYKGRLKDYVTYKVHKNVIEGSFHFSCLAYAMEYPIYEDSQKAKALLSRFSPLFIEPTKEMMKSLTKGEFIINIKDYSQVVDIVEIPKEVHLEFHRAFHDYIDRNGLYPEDTDDYGYISRAMSEIIRYGVYTYLCENKKIDKKIVIDSYKYFEKNFDYIHTLLNQYENPKTKGKIYQYKKLYQKYGDKKRIKWYARMLGVTSSMITKYNIKLNIEEKGE